MMGTLSCPGLNSARLHNVIIFDKEVQVPELWSKVCSGKKKAQGMLWVLGPLSTIKLFTQFWDCTPTLPHLGVLFCSSPQLWARLCSRRLTRMVFTGVSHKDLIIEPQMGHGHSVLSQSPCLVWANDGGATQRLHCFQVLHQAVLLGHPFCCQWQSHLDRRERKKRFECKYSNKNC